MKNVLVLLTLCTLMMLLPAHHAFAGGDIFEMTDSMDKSDFGDLVDKARECASSNNFSCSGSNLEKAGKLARNKMEKRQLADARKYNSSRERVYEAEQRKVAEEKARVERQRAAEERQRVADSRQQQKENYSVRWYGDWNRDSHGRLQRTISIRCGDGSEKGIFHFTWNEYEPYWSNGGHKTLDEAARSACR